MAGSQIELAKIKTLVRQYPKTVGASRRVLGQQVQSLFCHGNQFGCLHIFEFVEVMDVTRCREFFFAYDIVRCEVPGLLVIRLTPPRPLLAGLTVP